MVNRWEGIPLLISCMGGLGLGLLYFGGLWLTVQRLTSSSHPYLLMGSSFVLRLSIGGLGFYGIMQQPGTEEGRLLCLGVAVASFLMVRILFIRLLTSKSART